MSTPGPRRTDGGGRHLMVTPYAPYRDGIANYAVQEVAAGRSAGDHVEVLSPLPSAAQHHLPLGTPAAMVRLVAEARKWDRVTVQFYPELFFRGCRSRNERLAVWALLVTLCRVTAVDLRIHEIQYAEAADDRRVRQLGRRALHAASKVTVHTAPEQARLTEAFDLNPGAVTLVAHGSNFTRRTDLDRPAARASLGVPDDAFVYLSIGFVQRHKGFDRGVRSLGRLDGSTRALRLYVVGDIRVDHPDLSDYRDELQALCERTEGAEFRRGYVSDELFDRWLVAADRVVLPYREIWSSSVIERAGVYGIPVIATDVGGLADQAPAGTVIVADDDALTQAMADAAGVSTVTSDPAGESVPQDRDALQELMRARGGEPPVRPPATAELTRTPRAGAQSSKPGVGFVKKLVARLTGWQVDPVAVHLDDVVDALQRDVETLSQRIAAVEAGLVEQLHDPVDAGDARRRPRTARPGDTDPGREDAC